MKEDQMTGQVEHADGTRGLDTFPSRWGVPPGAPHSEERASWVRRNVRVEQVRNLQRDARTLSPHEALAQVARLKAEDLSHPTPPGPAGETFSLEELVALLKWWATYGAGAVPK
jgi:hypothetical protein